MSNSKKVISNSIIYTVNNVVLKAFNFLLLPLYTNYLTTVDYGITNFVNNFNSVLFYIIAFSLYSAVVRFYADYKYDEEKVRLFFGTIITFVFCSGLIFLLLILVFNSCLNKHLFSGIPFLPTILLAMISVIFSCMYNIYQEILKSMQLAMKSAIVTLVYFFFQFGLNLIFVVIYNWGANGVLLSGCIVNVVSTFFMFIDLKKNNLIQIGIDKRMLKESLKYSIPLLPHDLSSNIAQLVSKVFINNYGSLSSVGLYSLASQFGTVSNLIQFSVNNAFQPWFFDQMNKQEENFKYNYIRIADILLWIYCILFLFLGLFSQELILIMASESYAAAWTVVPFIITTYSIKIPYYFYINILLYHKESTKYIFTATLVGSIINIILSSQIIPLLGMYGSVMADAIAMVIRVAIIVILSNQYGHFGYKIWKFIIVIFLNITFIFIGLYFSYTRFTYSLSLLNFSYKCLIALFYIVLAIYMQRKQIPLLIAVIRKKKK